MDVSMKTRTYAVDGIELNVTVWRWNDGKISLNVDAKDIRDPSYKAVLAGVLEQGFSQVANGTNN